jgi:hypothetical protein
MRKKHRNVSNQSPFSQKHKFKAKDEEDGKKGSPTNILEKPGKIDLKTYKNPVKIPIAGRLTDLG